MERYNKQSGRWTVCAPLNLRRGTLCSNFCMGHIYAFGGLGAGIVGAQDEGARTSELQEVEWYECTEDKWYPTISMLEKVWSNDLELLWTFLRLLFRISFRNSSKMFISRRGPALHLAR